MARRSLILPPGRRTPDVRRRLRRRPGGATSQRGIARGPRGPAGDRNGSRTGRPEIRRPARACRPGRRAAAALAPLGGAGDADATTLPPPECPSATALGHQAAIRSRHRMPGHAELTCQLAAGNEADSRAAGGPRRWPGGAARTAARPVASRTPGQGRCPSSGYTTSLVWPTSVILDLDGKPSAS